MYTQPIRLITDDVMYTQPIILITDDVMYTQTNWVMGYALKEETEVHFVNFDLCETATQQLHGDNEDIRMLGFKMESQG